ncbi:uncharacterized protein ACB058_010850 [Synchiropus picturatus]
MSVRRKKTGLLAGWRRSFTVARWRKGKENEDTVLDSRVVLTKMKLFSERPLSEQPTEGSAARDVSEPLSITQVESPHDEAPRDERSSDYLSEMFSASQLTRLYKFESEDSGVELPSGANSPSTPTGSEHSFMVHSRESSCHSSEAAALPELSTCEQCCEVDQDLLKEEEVLTPLPQLSHAAERVELRISEELDKEQCRDSGIHPQEEHEIMETGLESDHTTADGESMSERRGTRDSLEEYMEQCCRLSQTHDSICGSVGSGLGYLEHICQLLEKIGQLQEVNRRLQREICGLQKDGQVATRKEEFFQQHCSCGAAALAFPDCHPRDPALSDLSTIPEVTHHPLLSRKDMSPPSLWQRNMNRRSYTEGDNHFLCEGRDGLTIPRRRSENYTWSRVKDLVRRNKVKNGAALGTTAAALKMSCPQLYRPDQGPEEALRRNRNRNSMILLGHQNKADFSWS